VYSLDLALRGKHRLYAILGGVASVTVHNVTFRFIETEKSTNGTKIESGQIPSLYFKLSSH
jgi:hypothetical protein